MFESGEHLFFQYSVVCEHNIRNSRDMADLKAILKISHIYSTFGNHFIKSITFEVLGVFLRKYMILKAETHQFPVVRGDEILL